MEVVGHGMTQSAISAPAVCAVRQAPSSRLSGREGGCVQTPRRILHYMPDDKFLDWAIKNFEACAPGLNDYVIYNRQSADEVVYVKSLEGVGFAPVGSERYKQLVRDCRSGRYAALICHAMPARFDELAKAVRDHVKIAVLTWGHEIYTYINKPVYMPETRWALWTGSFRQFLVRNKVVLHAALKMNRYCPVERSLRALLRADCICPVIDEDYFAFARRFRWRRIPPMIPFSYEGIDACMAGIGGDVDGGHILVNNSAIPTGNHLDVFKRLKRLKVGNPLMVPLSYGDPGFAQVVREHGRRMFGEQFRPMDRFLPRAQYVAELRHCSHVVMGYRRQQAVGNVMMAMQMGAKVFFYRANPVYDFLRKQGAHVFLLEEATAHDFSARLAANAVVVNRAVLQNVWGQTQVRERTRGLVRWLYPEYEQACAELLVGTGLRSHAN